MLKNMGSIDKTVRILIALTIGVLYYTGALSGTMAIILGIVATVFIATSFVGYCPLYSILKISTCGSQPKTKE